MQRPSMACLNTDGKRPVTSDLLSCMVMNGEKVRAFFSPAKWALGQV